MLQTSTQSMLLSSTQSSSYGVLRAYCYEIGTQSNSVDGNSAPEILNSDKSNIPLGCSNRGSFGGGGTPQIWDAPPPNLKCLIYFRALQIYTLNLFHEVPKIGRGAWFPSFFLLFKFGEAPSNFLIAVRTNHVK